MLLRLSVLVTLILVAGLDAQDAAAIKNTQARAHYKKALEYGEKGLWAPEILELGKARTLEPLNSDILVDLGIAHAERKEWKAALAALRKAVAVAPASVRAHYNLALTLDRADPGKGAGIPEYRKTLALDPKHVDTLMNLGVDIGDRNAAEARPLFDRALRIAPSNAKVHLNFALLLKRQGDENAAVSEFEAAIRSNPDLLEARRQLISILMARREWTQVIAGCREILNREPDDAATRYNLAQALTRSHNEEEGKKEMQRVVALRKRSQDLQDAQALQGEGIRQLQAGKAQDAAKSFRSAVSLDASAGNHMYFGLALVGTGEMDAGLRELKTALELEPGNARAHLNLGSVYLQTGQEPAARQEFERALELDPWLAEAHNNLGSMLAKDEKFEDAARHLQLAVDLEPDYLEAIFNLGLALRNLNRIDDALKAFRRAAELAPDSAQAQYALGMTLRDKGDAAGSRVALDRAAALSKVK
ncbi:MAG: tetratricopeptide repeat protein [Bryobacteraceae bacterium]